MKKNALHQLTDFICETPPEAHPQEAMAIAARAFADTVGCMIYGSSSEVAKTALEAAKHLGGDGEIPLYGVLATHKLPLLFAALVGGACAHANDWDDWTDVANDHPSASLVPVLLALCAGRDDITGAALLDAYLIGLEVIFKIGEAVNMGHYNLGWHTTVTIGSFGAAAAAARLRRLPPERVTASLSLVTSLASGYVSQFGTMAKPLHAGFAAKNGLLAASLGKAGATASPETLDGSVSFQSLMTPGRQADFKTACARLGKPWGVLNDGIHVKYYPSCGYIHRVIDGALRLREVHQLKPDDVQSMRVSLPDFHLKILPFHQPQSKNEALFSPAYCTAAALMRGRCAMADFTSKAIADASVAALVERITVIGRVPKNSALNYDDDDPDIVEVTTNDGQILRQCVMRATGMKNKELSDAQMREKFRECTGNFMPDDSGDALYGIINELPAAASLKPLYRHLGASGA